MEAGQKELSYFGYNDKFDIDNEIRKVLNTKEVHNTIKELELDKEVCIDKITVDEVIKDSKGFYNKYFRLHDIMYANLDTANKIMREYMYQMISDVDAYRKYFNTIEMKDVFDIPLEFFKGNSMEGMIEKPVFVLSSNKIPKDIGPFVPISKVSLGDDITKLSTCTYIHEISHMLTEPLIGYSTNFFNKEVLPIFLEKLSAMELDPTGKLLRTSERRRLAFLKDNIEVLKEDRDFGGMFLSERDKLTSITYIESTLIAEKLFDNYINERKQKYKDKYIYDIQDIFDGKITVEEVLNKHEVNFNKGKDISLIKRHMYKKN